MNNSIAILSWIKYRIARINHYIFKPIATPKGPISHTRNRVGNGDGGQLATFSNTQTSQTRYGVRNGDGFQITALIEAVIFQTRDRIYDTINAYCLRNNYITRVRICSFFIIFSPIGDRSRMFVYIQIVINSIHICVMSPSSIEP